MSFTSRRDLRLAIAARSIGVLGDELAVITLLLRLQDDGHGAGTAAALLLAGLAPMALLGAPAGRLVDRASTRTLLGVTLTAQLAACLALTMVTALPAVLALVFLIGVGEAVALTAWQVLIAELAGPDRLTRALGWSQSMNALAFVVGPGLAGILTGLLGARVPLLVDAGTFALAAAGALLIRTHRDPRRRVTVPGADQGSGPADGAGADSADTETRPPFRVLGDPVLRAMVIVLAVFITAGAAVNVVEVFLIRSVLHESSTWFGLCVASWSVGVVAGGPLGGRLAAPRSIAWGTVLGSAVLGLAIVVMGLAPNVIVLAAISLVGGAANGVLNVTSSATVLLRAPEAVRGQVAGTISAVTNGAMVAAYVLGGALGGVLGPRTVFIGSGLLSLAAIAALGPGLLRAGQAASDPAGAPDPRTASDPAVTSGASPVVDQLIVSGPGDQKR